MNSKCQRDICTLVIISAFFTIAKTQNELKCPPVESLDCLLSYFHIFLLGHAQLFPVVQTDFYKATKAIQNSNSMKMQPLSPSIFSTCESTYENKINLNPCLPIYTTFPGIYGPENKTKYITSRSMRSLATTGQVFLDRTWKRISIVENDKVCLTQI